MRDFDLVADAFEDESDRVGYAQTDKPIKFLPSNRGPWRRVPNREMIFSDTSSAKSTIVYDDYPMIGSLAVQEPESLPNQDYVHPLIVELNPPNHKIQPYLPGPEITKT